MNAHATPIVRDHVTWPADVTLHPDHSMPEAVERMRERRRSFAPVVDGDAIVGVISLRQLDRSAGELEQSAQDCMMSTVPFVYDDDPLALAAAIAAQTDIEHFCVVDHEHLLIGILACPEGEGGELPDAAASPPVDPVLIRRRLAVTPGRAAPSDFGVLVTYAEGPTLYVDGRAVREPLDRPTSSLRRRRQKAMGSKL